MLDVVRLLSSIWRTWLNEVRLLPSIMFAWLDDFRLLVGLWYELLFIFGRTWLFLNVIEDVILQVSLRRSLL